MGNINDYFGAAILLVLFASVIVIIEVWARKKNPPGEISRKAVHITGGLGCLLFPFLIKSPWIVAGLAGIFSISLYFGQKKGFLQCLSNVERKSKGSEYYPLAICFIYFVSQSQIWLYFTSVLILTFSDAMAALIGKRFGKIYYTVVNDEKKTLEGSLVFFIATWFIATTLLVSVGGFPFLKSMLCSFLVAILLTSVEAISVGGTDNIFVPVLTCYVFLKITTKPIDEVFFQCLSLVGLIVLLQMIIHFFKIFSVRDSIIFLLFTYAAWSLGSVFWALPIIITFVIYIGVRAVVKIPVDYQISTHALLHTIIVPLSILILANALQAWESFYSPFLFSTLISFLMGGWVYLLHNERVFEKHRSVKAFIFAMGVSLLAVLLMNTILSMYSFEYILFAVLFSAGIVVIYDRHLYWYQGKTQMVFFSSFLIGIYSFLGAVGFYGFEKYFLKGVFV